MAIDVDFFDMWKSKRKYGKDELFHLFNASISTYALALNLKLNNTKYVVNPIFFSNHSAEILRLYRILETPLHKLFKRSLSDYEITGIICDESERILPNTIEEGKLLVKGLSVSSKKIQVIHNGVERRFAESESSLFYKKFGLKDFVLYVGHLGPFRKNGKNIVKALQKLDHHSVIIADVLHNEEGEWCKTEIKKSKNITLIEWLDHSDPLFASSYAAAHTFILPTRYETPGRAALEAGLAGANIVITPKGGTKEYFDKYAEYPNPLSPDSILNSIEKSLNKTRNDDLKKRILKKFIWEKIAAQTAEMYNKVLQV
jgi:glycosyltransferase involved in cell wall biosynthesis